jgi:colicin import membrane protein
MAISFCGHLLLFALFIFSPSMGSDDPYMPGIIDVQIVDVPLPKGGAPKKTPETRAPAPVKEPAAPREIEPVAPKQPTAAKPEVSVAPKKPKAKTALKYKTLKSKEVLKSALKQLEQKVESQPDRQLEDTIKRLKDQVAEDDRRETPAATPQVQEGTGNKPGLFGKGSKQEAEAIDIYHLEVAYRINKNWAFSDQLAGAGTDLMAWVTFKVMPDGAIADISFTQRSGNVYLDESAYKAIMKSSPVQPHPPGLARPYIIMGIRFTPQGVQ